ncbi:TldD/PmbA family protein [Proteiniborus sp. MB09-C3]|uniref:TldD/PmbA family protein n=1 Tax=Proteiniborus sp. MB09-C3 TaxID=3050072 RepID=UPI0025521B16|nr:TldD/PmbA family protein [Proteiniborus sp. MB09-C3]WIV12332.1 TldD/PmbA family protein [Proteiniborus sp. MB09-C3]
MYTFPKNLYTDVRLEDASVSEITYQNGDLMQNLKRNRRGGFIRIFDGKRWYYSSTTDIDNIQEEINKLALMANENEYIMDNPVVKKFEVNKGEFLQFKENDILNVSQKEKLELLKSYFPFVENKEEIKMWRAVYIDRKTTKEFYSSKGANLKFNYQTCAIVYRYSLNIEGKTLNGGCDKTTTDFNELKAFGEKLENTLARDIEYTKTAKPITPGKYTVIFAPIATGVFTHESFGHKSEADFMVGDEAMMKEWTIGKKVGADNLSIVDTGSLLGSGFVPFDDEGTKSNKTYLIKNGILSGRLHSSATAESLKENPTGNARALNFEFEPIVRMTNTYIEAGNKTKEELISEVKEGILVEEVNHGSGMSTFTIAPSISYMIRDGKIAEPVNIAVVSGNVMETLHNIDGISKEIEVFSSSLGGCGKMEQFPLPVGMGGPYIRVNNMTVQ